MAKKCDLCGRSATKGASRSHSKIKTLKRQGINLQSKTIAGDKFRLCTSCLRTMDKPKRVKAKRATSAPSAAAPSTPKKTATIKKAIKTVKKAAKKTVKKIAK